MANPNNVTHAAAQATAPINFVADVRTMTSREIASLTGKEHRNVLRDARAMLIELHGEGGLLSFEQTHTDPQNGQAYPVLALPKRECLILVSGYSVKMRAAIIDRWEALESGRAAPVAAQPSAMAERIQCLGLIADGLRLDGSARLGVYQRGVAIIAPDLVPALPVYATDAPTGAASAIGSEPTSSLSELLRQHGAATSAQRVNKMLADAGFVEQRTRSTTRGQASKFWSITEKGAAYGKNTTSPSNPKETQPHWYVSRFPDLMEEIGVPIVLDAAAMKAAA